MSNSKTKFYGMRADLLYTIILDNLWDAENTDLSRCEYQISK